MEKGMIFWMLMILWAIFGVGSIVTWNTPTARWGFAGSTLLLFVLFVLIGLRLFGDPIK